MRLSTTSLALLMASTSLAALDRASLATKYFGNDAPWYLDRIPFFESSDADITNVYYYRWKIFRSHQRDLGANGYISTEFLNDVSWQTNPWASLNDATGFHLLEGRWCRDRRFKEDYANFIFSSSSNRRQFSENMADGVWKGYLIDGDINSASQLLDEMQTVYNAWADSYNSTRGLYWVEPLRDATEYTISSIDASGGTDGFTGGESYRPSINSYQYANAKAIANIASAKGGLQSVVDTYTSRAAAIKKAVQASLWNSTFEHFIDRYYVSNNYVKNWAPIRGRELVGYVPWTHDLPDDTTAYAQSWKHILNTAQLAGEHGLRTNEPSYQYYMRQYRYAGTQPECQWNGPVWPYQTTQVLAGLGNLLDHYPNSSAANVITRANFLSLLKQYAQLHYLNGTLNIEEDYNPATGLPIVGLARSPHYFHSGFVDLVISYLIGVRGRADDYLEVNPLVANTPLTYFRIENIPYHGHTLAVQYDSSGSRYGTKGLQIEIDGKVAASAAAAQRVVVPLSRATNPTVQRPIAKSVQLQASSAYPVASVSVQGADPNAVHQAIDGRVYFFAENPNGWDSPVGNGTEIWLAVDFGNVTTVSSAEVAFWADAGKFDVPDAYRVQVLSGSTWKDVSVSGGKYAAAVGNGVTNVGWTGVSTREVRLVFTPKKGKGVRVVEFKIF
ncbi:six-hairpin glycosidase protein [Rutstroemia sp. NJR-2017a WRK4]|nr:six-hairpin glycosidase protein [Rutstroemia sp. NJR-2017a WRK4]